MDLIIINGYTPPSPAAFDVDFSDIYGAEEQLENGYSHVEQVRTQVPRISLEWRNIAENDAAEILAAVQPATFACQYFFGTMKTDTFKCKSPKLKLKLVQGNTRYYDLSIGLEG